MASMHANLAKHVPPSCHQAQPAARQHLKQRRGHGPHSTRQQGGRWSRAAARAGSGNGAEGEKGEKGSPTAVAPASGQALQEGPSTDFSLIWARLTRLALPYWTDPEAGNAARWRLAAVVGLTLGTTGVSVLFNFLGKDFFTALSQKDTEKFTEMLVKWLAAVVVGVPVFVFRGYVQARLALEWRDWLTRRLTGQYLADRTFYRMQANALVDNPDQRIASDVQQFTETALSFGTILLNAAVDLVSFSEIMYSIYPPLFVVLVGYSLGGTGVSVWLGRRLIGLNFAQEAQEANFRYGLVRVRENAESIAFYGGEGSEQRLLFQRLGAVVANYAQLLVNNRNLDFFTSYYRFLIQILPAALVAPLYFQGRIEFGVINQSASAFNHILSDVSLVVYQFENLAGFGAVIDRLGQFEEVVRERAVALPASSIAPKGVLEGAEQPAAQQAPAQQEGSSGVAAVAAAAGGPAVAAAGNGAAGAGPGAAESGAELAAGAGGVSVEDTGRAGPGGLLLELREVALRTPGAARPLVEGLDLQVREGESLLVVGPSGAGKTSLLRAVAGLWDQGSGAIVRHGRPVRSGAGDGDIFFVPQRPYMVLGTLREQLLYPTWAASEPSSEPGAPSAAGAPPFPTRSGVNGNGAEVGTNGAGATAASEAAPGPRRPPPSDEALAEALRGVQLGHLLDDPRTAGGRRGSGGAGLDAVADWAGTLSLGEQQRIAFARVLLARPRLVLMDESTSALDTRNEAAMYAALARAGITCVSVGHRPSLADFHAVQLTLQGGAKEAAGGASSGSGQDAAGWKLTRLGSGQREAAGTASLA